MAYTKQTWADLPSKTTPINANRLTHIEDGIFNAAATADNAASAAGTAVSQIGQVSSRVDTLTGRVNGLDTAVSNKVDKVAGKGLSTNDYDNADKGKVDSLGTASTKNSTSVVTESSDLVESGAVKDIVGWGNKNKLQVRKELTSTSLFTVNRNNYDEVTSIVGNGSVTAEQTLWLIGDGWNYSNCEDASKYFKAGHTYTLSDGTNNDNNQFIQLNIRDSEGVIISARSDNLNTYYRTFTMPSDLTGLKVHCWLRVNNGQSMTNKAFYPQVEEGASITSFEPYHASVSDSLAEKCDNSTIAPTENGSTTSQAYAVGSHAIRNGAFITWKNAKAQGETINDASDYTSGDVADDFLKIKNVTVTLNTLTWNTTNEGMNYAPVSVSDVNKILGVSIGDWWSLTASAIVIPTINAQYKGIVLMCPIIPANGTVKLVILYK